MTSPSRRWLLLPTALWSIVFIVVPFLIVFAFSLTTRGLHGEVVWDLQWANYLRVFDASYAKVAWFSVKLAVWNTVLCLAAGYPLAYFMAHIESAATRNLFLILILVPFWTNFLVRTYALGNILGDEGLINQFLLWLGIIKEPLDLIYSKKAMVIGLVSNYLPFMVLPLFVALEKQDKHLLEAAKDLGASPLRAFARVTWPLSVPGVATGCLLVFIPSVGEFIIPDLLGGGKYLVIGTLLQQKFLIIRDWPMGATLSIVLAIVLLGLLALSYRIRGEDEEAF
jgi:spermidine/putrescine transport system permease protein